MEPMGKPKNPPHHDCWFKAKATFGLGITRLSSGCRPSHLLQDCFGLWVPIPP